MKRALSLPNLTFINGAATSSQRQKTVKKFGCPTTMAAKFKGFSAVWEVGQVDYPADQSHC